MMIKLQDIYCYFLQAFAVRHSGWHDCHKQPGSMAWLPRAAAVMPRRTATVVSWMLTSIVFQLNLTMLSGSGSGRGDPVNVDHGFPNIRFFPPPELFSSIV